MRIKKLLFVIAFIFVGLFILTHDSFAAVEFSLALPSGMSVTMGDPSATMPFNVLNSAVSTKNIRAIEFIANTALYNIGFATTAPSGWSIKSISSTSVCFTNPSGGIAPGGNLVFNIALTGVSSVSNPTGAIPSSAQDVTTDALSGSTASSGSASCTPEFTLTNNPTWTRKSLAISMTATPSSVGVGETITVTMYITNRSTSTQSGIAANPSPPSAYLYGLTNLTGTHNSTVTTITVASTTDFTSSGTIRIDNEDITYTGKTATTFTGCTRGANGTTASFHPDQASIFNKTSTSAVSNTGGGTSLTLSAGEASSITWTYRADSSATVHFTSSAQNSGGTVTSKSEYSNSVVIGNFTSSISITPLSIVSGQTVTVTMTVKNNGTSALTNVTPTLTPGGTATKTLLSGPTPSSIASLGSGESGTFQWGYTITGSVGQTYYFSGYASSGGPNSNTSISATGVITTYSVTISPNTVISASTNVQIGWTVYNTGSKSVKEVDISFPSGWTYSSNTPPAGCTGNLVGSTVSFTCSIAVGSSKTFYITFSSAPTVTSDTIYMFPVKIIDQSNNESTINTYVTVTAYQLTLTTYDEDCTSSAPASKPADGDSKYCLKAYLTSGGSPKTGKSINFSITSGTGTLYPGSSVNTDANGYATVYLISPCSTTNISTTVKAEYTSDTYDTKTLLFTGVGGSNLSYVVGSLSPTSIVTGNTPSFTLKLRNCGTSSLTISNTSTFKLGSKYTQTLSSSISILAGGEGTLTFNPTVPIGSESVKYFNDISLSKDCRPILDVDAAGYSGTFSNGDPIDGSVTINSGERCPVSKVRILDWREVVQ